MSELKKEFKNYLDDLEKNIKNKEDLEYVKERTTDFMNVVLEEMEQILNYKDDKISQIEKIQNAIEQKIENMQQDIAEIEQDIYLEDDELAYYEEIGEPSDYDFEIVCPYCNNEFLIDLNQENSEIECPKCNNIIELDWTGDTDENAQINGCGAGHCSSCPGCGNIETEEDDDM